MSIFGKFFESQKNSHQFKKNDIIILKGEIRKLESEKEKYVILQKIIATLVADFNFERISQEIVDIMVKDLNYIGGVLFLVNDEKKEIQGWTFSQTKLIKGILKLLPKNIRKYKALINKQGHYISKSAASGEIFIGHIYSDFLCPTLSKKFCNLAQKTARIKTTISLPIIVKNKVIGVLMFNSRNNEFTENEIDLLKTFTQQAGIAISNAQQFEQIQTQVKQLQEKTEDMESLLDISEIAGSSLKTKNVAQNIVDSIPKNLKHLGYEGGILVLYNKERGYVYTYALTESKIVKKAKKLLNKSLKEHLEYIDQADNLVIKTIKTKKMQVGGKLEDFIAPTVSKKVCGLIQKLVGAKSFISIPLLSGGRIKGTIVFVGVKPKSKIVQRDKDILFGFSSHIGAAIENAQLYEQTEKQIKALSILNENLKMANIRLKELMEMKTEFLHITSHQLRTPLTTIRGMISMWYSGDFDDLPDKEKRKMLKRIYISSERLNNITNDMLDSLELEGGLMKFQFKQASLREIVKETVDIMKPNFDKKNLYLKFNDSADIPKVEVEPNYIRQVFMNIIDNACKYTRKGGVEIDIKKTGKYVEVIIKDTGIGVSKSDQKKIFQKFTRGKKASIENASGSGLGLFIARKIVDAHKGKIEFISEGAGKGSVVKVLLPVKQG